MKKNFFKKLSLVLAFAMVISAFAPAGAVFAAKKPALNAPATKYVHVARNAKGKNYTFNFNIKNKPAGKNKYKWTSSKPAIATVNAKNGIVNAKKAGATNIKVVITPAKGKKVTLSTKLVVRDNIVDVDVKNPIEETIVVGTEHDFNRTIVATESGATKSTGVTRWLLVEKAADEKSEDKVTTFSDKGVITFGETGKFSVRAVSFQSNAKYNEWVKADEFDLEDKLVTAKSDAYDFEVVNAIVDEEQITTKKFELTFAANAEKLVKKDNVTLIDGKGINVTSIIKSVTVKENVATVETFVDLNDKELYTGKAAGLEYELTASKGDVFKVEIVKPDKVEANVSTKLEVKYFDANGVEVEGDNGKVTFKVLNEEESVSVIFDDHITMFEVGKVASVKATYATGKYDADWKEIEIESDAFAITAVKDLSATIGSTSNWGIFDNDKTPKTADDFKDAVKVLPLDATGKKLFVYAKDSNGDDVDTSKFKFESTNPLVLLVTEAGDLIPVSEGEAGVIVKSGEFQTVITVKVGAKSKAATITVDPRNVVLSATAGEKQTFKVEVKDQYGNVLKLADQDFEFLGKVEDNPGKMTTDFVFDAADVPKGTYNYRLKANGKDTVVSIVVQASDDNVVATYRFDVADIDTTVTDGTDGTETLDIKAYSYDKAGVKLAPVTGASITVTGADGVKTSDTVEFYTVTGGAITGKLKAQRYTVTGTINLGKDTDGKDIIKTIVPTYFTVKDTQKAPTVNQLGSTAIADDLTTLASLFESGDNNVSIKDGNVVRSGKTVVVKAVTVREVIGKVTVETDVTVNKVITIK